MTFPSGPPARFVSDAAGEFVRQKPFLSVLPATWWEIVTKLLRNNRCRNGSFSHRLPMPRKATIRDEVLSSEDVVSVVVAPRRKSRTRKSVVREREITSPRMTPANRLPQDPV